MLIDQLLPRYDVVERHRLRRVRATAERGDRATERTT
jgi:hypothetical protein